MTVCSTPLTIPDNFQLQEWRLIEKGRSAVVPVGVLKSQGTWIPMLPISLPGEPDFLGSFVGLSSDHAFRADLLPGRVTVRRSISNEVVFSVLADDAKFCKSALYVLRGNSVAVYDLRGKIRARYGRFEFGRTWSSIDRTCNYLLGVKKQPSRSGVFDLFAIDFRKRKKTPVNLNLSVDLGSADMPQWWTALSDSMFLVVRDVAVGRSQVWITGPRAIKCISNLSQEHAGFVIDILVQDSRIHMLLADEEFQKHVYRIYERGSYFDVPASANARILVPDCGQRQVGVLSWVDRVWRVECLADRWALSGPEVFKRLPLMSPLDSSIVRVLPWPVLNN